MNNIRTLSVKDDNLIDIKNFFVFVRSLLKKRNVHFVVFVRSLLKERNVHAVDITTGCLWRVF